MVAQERAATRESVIATGISFEQYMEQYAADYAEWVNGEVIRMSPVREIHDSIFRFLIMLFTAYLEQTGGTLRVAPFVMRLDHAREPDLQVILPEHLERIKDTLVDGPADLVVEIVSPESTERDRGDKFAEYERGGVAEYWIVDAVRKETLFYVLNADGIYEGHKPDEAGEYHSVVLSRLHLPADIFWRHLLPTLTETVRMVEAMLSANP
jgi:Uma2 family endonuclease